jgi:two-component system response regulator HydG
MLRLLLSDEHDVVIATSIRDAIELVKTQSFDLYVLDRRLPDGSGMELCTLLNQVTPNVPCIFYTGDAYEVHRQQALAAGAEEYISKPNIEELISTVTRILSEKECAATT